MNLFAFFASAVSSTSIFSLNSPHDLPKGNFGVIQVNNMTTEELVPIIRDQDFNSEFFPGAAIVWDRKCWRHVSTDFTTHSKWAILRNEDRYWIIGVSNVRDDPEVNAMKSKLMQKYPNASISLRIID